MPCDAVKYAIISLDKAMSTLVILLGDKALYKPMLDYC